MIVFPALTHSVSCDVRSDSHLSTSTLSFTTGIFSGIWFVGAALGLNALVKSFCIAGLFCAVLTACWTGLGAFTQAIAPIGCAFGTTTGAFGNPLLTGNQPETYHGFAPVLVDIIGASV